ncbi:MAG: YbaK/EbsC family protein [Candidatus Aenigmarchaeota archaeon]|nr:YbaK/EbsC family protein [Candidatus Aenigmarchaeota archaeon]
MFFVYNKIVQLLKEKEIPFEETEHEHVYTSEDASRVRGLPSARAGVKSLIFKTDAGKFILVLVPGDSRADTKILCLLENCKNIGLANPQEVERIAGVEIGAVGPFGLKTELKTYLSNAVLENEFVFFNPGLHTKTIKMRSVNLLKVLEGAVRF